MDFYAFIPSNASTRLFADNATSHYKVQLPNRLELCGKWQVALVQVQYPNTIAQIVEGENAIKLQHRDGHEDTFFVRPGYYANQRDFLFALHNALTPIEALPEDKGRRSVLEITSENHVLIHALPDFAGGTLSFSPRLAMQMGLEHPGPYTVNEQLCAPNAMDLSLGIPPMLFIYFDKITEQIVGDCYAPLLATIPTEISGRYGSVSVFSVERPLYLDLATKNFDVIEVDIRDHAGKYVSFNYGTSMLLCHFRRVAEN